MQDSSVAELERAGIAMLVAGGAVFVAGAILLPIGIVERLEVENAMDGALWPDLVGPYDRAPILEAAGGIALGVGAALAAVGIVLVLSASEASYAAVRVSPNGLLLRGAF